jgi:hypothetical protein
MIDMKGLLLKMAELSPNKKKKTQGKMVVRPNKNGTIIALSPYTK